MSIILRVGVSNISVHHNALQRSLTVREHVEHGTPEPLVHGSIAFCALTCVCLI